MKENKVNKLEKLLKENRKLRERLLSKAKKISNELEFDRFIENEIMPIAKKHNIKLTKKELLNFEKENLKKLDFESLAKVSGGLSLKPILLSGGILSAIMRSASVNAMQAFATEKEPTSYSNLAITSKDHKKIITKEDVEKNQ